MAFQRRLDRRTSSTAPRLHIAEKRDHQQRLLRGVEEVSEPEIRTIKIVAFAVASLANQSPSLPDMSINGVMNSRNEDSRVPVGELLRRNIMRLPVFRSKVRNDAIRPAGPASIFALPIHTVLSAQ